MVMVVPVRPAPVAVLKLVAEVVTCDRSRKGIDKVAMICPGLQDSDRSQGLPEG